MLYIGNYTACRLVKTKLARTFGKNLNTFSKIKFRLQLAFAFSKLSFGFLAKFLFQ